MEKVTKEKEKAASEATNQAETLVDTVVAEVQAPKTPMESAEQEIRSQENTVDDSTDISAASVDNVLDELSKTIEGVKDLIQDQPADMPALTDTKQEENPLEADAEGILDKADEILNQISETVESNPVSGPVQETDTGISENLPADDISPADLEIVKENSWDSQQDAEKIFEEMVETIESTEEQVQDSIPETPAVDQNQEQDALYTDNLDLDTTSAEEQATNFNEEPVEPVVQATSTELLEETPEVQEKPAPVFPRQRVSEPVNRISPVQPKVRGEGNFAPALVVHHDRGCKNAEEYRALRTSLLARCPEDRFCFMVTSAERREGKTISCLNLALVMTEKVDCRTVVVDLDLRNGQMANLLGVSAGSGVAEYLSGTAPLDEIIQPTIYPNLSFISTGQVDKQHPGELLSRGQLKKMVAQLRQDYDFVLLDTPAINVFADAGVAGLAASDAILVVQAGKTSRESVQQAIHALQNANVNLVGLLMTHCQHRFVN